MFRLLLGVMASSALLACGGDEEEDKPLTCEDDCARQVAAGCANTPPNYLETCRQSCASNRDGLNAECRDELAAIYACAGKSVRYTCNASGNVYGEPVGACAVEAVACAACAGLACLP